MHKGDKMVSRRVEDGMDSATAGLIVQLQLEELAQMEQNTKGKASSQQPLPDAETALGAYRAELRALQLSLADQAMARSIGAAIRSDGLVIAGLEMQEQQATQDRRTARQMAGALPAGNIQTPPASATDLEWTFNEPMVEPPAMRAEPVTTSTLNETPAPEAPEPVIAGPSRGGRASTTDDQDDDPPRRIMCESCREEKLFFDVIHAPCEHGYCRKCLRELFDLSMTDESVFPPRCCQQTIPVELAQPFLSPDLIDRFELRRQELATTDRTYCFSESCARFIPPPDIIHDRAHCKACGKTTCQICKSEAHEGDCPNDPAVQAVKQLAQERGWRECWSCHRIVELEHGCNHMT